MEVGVINILIVIVVVYVKTICLLKLCVNVSPEKIMPEII